MYSFSIFHQIEMQDSTMIQMQRYKASKHASASSISFQQTFFWWLAYKKITGGQI
jgi:hypothetical protein